MIFVTHDRYFLDVIATRIVELADGRAFAHPGNYTAYLESKAIRQQIAEQTERRRQRFLREELEWVRSGVRAQRSKPRHRLRCLLPGRRTRGAARGARDGPAHPARAGDGQHRRGPRSTPARKWATASAGCSADLTLSLKPGQCTGIVGRNGVGKTTLLRLCLGQRAGR